MEHLEIVTPPASEPVTLADAKLFLRVDIDDDDLFITSLITAARMVCEAMARQTFVPTTYNWYLDEFPASANGYFNRFVRMAGPSPQWLPNGAAILYLPKPPLISVASVLYIDPTGEQQSYDLANTVISTGIGSRIQPIIGFIWPVIRPQIDGVVVQYTSGWSTVPANVLTAIKVLITHYYENRDTVATGTIVASVPDTVDALLSATDHGCYA